MQQLDQQQVERVSIDDERSSLAEVEASMVEAQGLQRVLSELADSFDVSGFKCVNCGLAHQHDTTKHRLSDDFDITEAEAADMTSNSVCHCGVQEAGRHGSDLGIDEGKAAQVATNAPVPPEETRELNEQFGSL